VAVAACALAPLSALDPDRDVSQYVRDQWNAARGFMGGPVYAFAQTMDGYLWIGSENGLVRFDGVNFQAFQPSVSGRSLSGTVLGLVTDSDGVLWIRLAGPTLLRYRAGTFSAVSPDAGEAIVTAMIRGRDGRLLMSSLQQGILRERGGRFDAIASPAQLPKSVVISIAETASGTAWLGTRDAGLRAVGSDHSAKALDALPDRKVNALLAVGGDELWIGTDKGVVRWDGRALGAAGVPDALAAVQALSMIRDRAGNVWVGTAGGQVVRANARGAAVLDDEGASRGAVTALFEDRDGNLWIGSGRGIERLRDSAFVTYSTRQGVPAESGGPIHVDAAGAAWIAPPAGGLYRLERGTARRIAIGGPVDDVVYSIAGTGRDVWIGRQRGGLTQLRESGGEWAPRSYTEATGLAQNSIYAVHESRDGTIWAGTLSAGLSVLKRDQFTTVTAANGLVANTVGAIAEAADGSMWFGTPSGLSVLSQGQWRSYTSRDGLPSNDITCLAAGVEDTVWIGTADGLAVARDGKIVSLSRLPDALRESIASVAATPGFVWVATPTHVMRVARAPLLAGALADGDVREYGALDGLLSVQGVRRHRSIVAGSGGLVWFSLARGMSSIDPSRPAGGSAPAIPHVEAVSADGTSVGLDGNAQVPPGRQRLTFTYAGLSLAVPERVRFRYRLDGFDHEWSEPVSARSTVYTNLGPGQYRFRVMASNSEGAWSGSEATVAFAIAPRIWQTVWFQMAAVLTTVMAGAALYRLRVHQVARQLNRRFEERLAERTRIAQDLHDTLLQGFVSASMQLHVAASHVAEGSQARSAIDHVLQLMSRVLEEGRNAVRGLRAPATPDDDLERAFCRVQQELPVPPHIGFRVVVEGRPRPLHPLIRDEVYRIGREALANAVRHASAQTIELELDYAPAQLRLLVRDNGSGIDEQVLRSGRDGHWGLSGMRERADRIGGRLKVWSRAAAGTEVELTVPGHAAFQPVAAAKPQGPGGAAHT